MENETNQPEAPVKTDPGYTLTPGEQMGFASMNQQILNAKLAIYNLQLALDKARKDAEQLETKFGGALGFLGHSHGMGTCKITPDFSYIAPQE